KSEEGKIILLAIDSRYLGFYSGYSTFKKANKHYLCDMLGLDELYECQKRHTRKEFENISRKYNLKSKIIADKGVLSTDLKLDEISRETELDLQLPTDKFYKYELYETHEDVLSPNTRHSMGIEDLPNIPFSLAVTYNDTVKYSCLL